MKGIKYTDDNGVEQIGEFIEIDNNTLIYRDIDGTEKATANWSE